MSDQPLPSLPADGFLQGLPAAVVDQVVAGASLGRLEAGAVLNEAQPALIVHGEVAVFITGPDGDRLTVSHLHAGDVIGASRVVGHRSAERFQATTATSLLYLDAERLERLCASEPLLSNAIAGQLMDQLGAILEEMAPRAFGRPGHQPADPDGARRS